MQPSTCGKVAGEQFLNNRSMRLLFDSLRATNNK